MKKHKKKIVLSIISIIGIVILIYGFSLAKYVSNSIWDYYLKSKGFYFSSDQLSINTLQHEDNLWEGNSVHFGVKNNLNEEVITNYDINYSVVCTIEGEASQYSECHLNGTNSNTYNGTLSGSQICFNYTNDNVDVSLYNKAECELGGYDWEYQIAENDLYFDVILTDTNHELDHVVVKVTATSNSPYNKTLIGQYTLNKRAEENNVIMDYKSYSNYDRLNISNTMAEEKCVKLSWNSSDLLIENDKSDFLSHTLDTDGYINQVEFNINASSNVSYIFYKRNFSGTYTVDDFTLVENCSN